jgi:AcrR family transcriptional regulator
VKEEHNRKDTRRHIAETALGMFLEKGIKDVKMDDIASVLSISKRTIYEHFADKEQLLLESLKLHSESMRKEAKEKIREAKHVLDIILGIYTLYLEKLRQVSKKFFTEIEKYPNINKRNRDRETKNHKRFIAWMEVGRKQGLFREDANFEILLYIICRDLETIFKVSKNNEDNELGKYSPDELGRTLILFYLRGISTPKGQDIIETYLKKNKKTI